jgi:predicted flap endonuclease-1-like 5' DNA nuclease
MDEMTTTAVVADDLTKIEGIGPAVAEVLNGVGIHTYTDLANTSVESLNEMMSEAGPGFSFRDTTTWPEQASLAAEGRWEELQAWQAELDGGKVVAESEEE